MAPSPIWTSLCSIQWLQNHFSFVEEIVRFPIFSNSKDRGECPNNSWKMQELFQRTKKCVWNNSCLQKYFNHLKTSFASYDCKLTFFCNMFEHRSLRNLSIWRWSGSLCANDRLANDNYSELALLFFTATRLLALRVSSPIFRDIALTYQPEYI